MALIDDTAYELLLETTEKGLDTLKAVSMQAIEALSTPFQVSLEVRTLDPCDPGSLDAGSWLRKRIAIGLARSADPTWFHGVIVAVEHVGSDHEHFQTYRLELAPAVALLAHTRRTRVFVDKKPIEVVKSVLAETAITVDMKAIGAGGVQRHITQFEESDFAFVSRLLEQEGACYWFTHTKSAHTMVIGDAATHHPGSGAAFNATYAASEEKAKAHSEGVVTALSRRFEVVPKDALVNDYSESHPKQAALGQKSVVADKAPGAAGKHAEADYHVTQSDGEATTYATRLAEGHTCRSCRLVGSSGMVVLRSGVRLAVSGKDGYDEHMILNRVEHTYANGSYANGFSAVPVSRLPWRPARLTPLPRIDGFVPGLVTAAAGAQGSGEDGAYRIKLLNGEGEQDRIVRMAQPYAGPAQGMHFPLPVNTEVVLAHEYGHPDRPIIAGAMHNAEDPSPVVEANKSQCVLMSAAGAALIFEDKADEEKITLKSKGTGMLEMDDKPGKEKVTLQSKSLHKLELDDKSGDEKITLQSQALHKLEFHDKGGSEKVALTTKGTQKLEFLDASGSEKVTLYAKKDHEVTVDGKSETTVKGKKSIDCKDEIEITAATKITLKCGAAKIILESGGKITIEGTEVAIDGKTKVAIKGAMIAIEAQGTLDAKGNGPVTLQSSAITTVKGSMVMIN